MNDIRWMAGHFFLIFAITGTYFGAALPATEVCVSASVPGPIVLPDGAFYPAGQIRICLTERLSPAAGLHETTVGGHPVGMFLSHSRRIEASPTTEPEASFHFMRTERGAWILEAYSITEGKRVVLYQLRPPAPPVPPTEANVASADIPEVLVASVGH